MHVSIRRLGPLGPDQHASSIDPACTFFSRVIVPSLPSKTATTESEEAEKKRAPSGEKRVVLTNRSCVLGVALNLNGGPS